MKIASVECHVLLAPNYDPRFTSSAQDSFVVVPHCWMTAISISATAHLAFTQPHCAFIEYLPPELCFETLRKELAVEDLRLENGEIPLPTKPGLGFELNRDALSRFTVA